MDNVVGAVLVFGSGPFGDEDEAEEREGVGVLIAWGSNGGQKA